MPGESSLEAPHRMFSAKWEKHFACGHSKAESDPVDVFEREVSFTSLYLADVAPVQGAAVREIFLRNAQCTPQLPHPTAECAP